MNIMKKGIVLLSLTYLFACNPSTEKKVDATMQTETIANSYGEKIEKQTGITVAALAAQMQNKAALEDMVIEAKITEVCQEMGCWMNVEKGDGTQMFIKMKDHEFFVPKDAAGKIALISGTAV
ncbi:MAG TPA: DUF4920 domain-containing protein, partial [Bacteroidia bacterium]|nr:DUF4920 domain-containing protein [Bacteroidia bacterium]